MWMWIVEEKGKKLRQSYRKILRHIITIIIIMVFARTNFSNANKTTQFCARKRNHSVNFAGSGILFFFISVTSIFAHNHLAPRNSFWISFRISCSFFSVIFFSSSSSEFTVHHRRLVRCPATWTEFSFIHTCYFLEFHRASIRLLLFLPWAANH